MKKDIYKYDLENGVTNIKVGIKNLLFYLNTCEEGEEIDIENVHIKTVLNCIKEQGYKYNLCSSDFGKDITIEDLNIYITCLYAVNEIRFIKCKNTSELNINFI